MTGGNWLGLSGKTIVVTGGSGGIGRAILRGALDAGARVVVLDYDAKTAEETAREADSAGCLAIGLGCDVSDTDSVAAAAEAVAERWGGCDVLINNAGILRPGPLEDLSLEDWTRMLDVNLNGCLIGSQIFGKQMVERGGGAIVHVASISASQPQPFSGAYSPGKAAVAMLSRQLAYEWGPKRIRSNVISPGLVLTPLSEAFYKDEDVRRARERLVPVGRIGRPQDMADVALFLASDRAAYVNGQEIVVDGGLSQTLMGTVPRPGYSG
ncbi:SDR family NAD(P)-dependent oxidoreductase [Roseibium aggregatum]|uniref:SDR family oxidoreductase n=1 Tax=Roseibium aggregatum TaxID=187304 RepID=A0A926P407_9HYPH|nr:SDR family NAD(P)-dependent oxidoreductase [Roseibium aggregatum]MBD1549395.1 SDR family oxidoreductase [Roseibium aggregatum]